MNRKQMNIRIKEVKTQLTRESGSQVLTNQHAVRNQGQFIGAGEQKRLRPIKE